MGRRVSATQLTPRQRDALIRRLRANGWTLEAIAQRYGLTKQRVWQIVRRG